MSQDDIPGKQTDRLSINFIRDIVYQGMPLQILAEVTITAASFTVLYQPFFTL
jgi:hypothetical protein